MRVIEKRARISGEALTHGGIDADHLLDGTRHQVATATLAALVMHHAVRLREERIPPPIDPDPPLIAFASGVLGDQVIVGRTIALDAAEQNALEAFHQRMRQADMTTDDAAAEGITVQAAQELYAALRDALRQERAPDSP